MLYKSLVTDQVTISFLGYWNMVPEMYMYIEEVEVWTRFFSDKYLYYSLSVVIFGNYVFHRWEKSLWKCQTRVIVRVKWSGSDPVKTTCTEVGQPLCVEPGE